MGGGIFRLVAREIAFARGNRGAKLVVRLQGRGFAASAAIHRSALPAPGQEL
jgi:hypothetical protein